MAHVYDNWERLVRATLRREELRFSGQRTPSDLSLASSSSFSFSADSSRHFSSFNFASLLLVGEAFKYHQILWATDHFSESNLIKRGRSGDLFRGNLQDAIQIVVKRVDLSSVEKEQFLMSELDVLGKVSYRRLVPLLGHCLENGSHKFLIYKYMPNLDLSSSFYREIVSDDDYRLPSLDWITRLKIATDAADTLCYLHYDCVPPLVHGDVQASSILLDDKYEVRLGSLTKVCVQENNSNQSGMPSKTEQGTPEYDVYCFGKVLMELVTGKLGVSVAPANDAGIKNWMAETLPNISVSDREPMEKIIDPSLLIDEDLLLEVWAIAIVAKACLNPNPSRRPMMRYVLSALENPLSVVIEEYTRLPAQLLPSAKLDEDGDEAPRLNLNAKLYRFDKEGKQWIERGIGTVKILRHKKTGKYRVVMRETRTLKICANHPVVATMKVGKQADDKACVWRAADSADGVIKDEVFCLRFASVEDCKTFVEMVQKIATWLRTSQGPNFRL